MLAHYDRAVRRVVNTIPDKVNALVFRRPDFGQLTAEHFYWQYFWFAFCSLTYQTEAFRDLVHFALMDRPVDVDGHTLRISDDDVRRVIDDVGARVDLLRVRDEIYSGWPAFYARLGEDWHGTLGALPFMGSFNMMHVAQNVGIDCVRPDRRLAALASRFGFVDEHEMCSYVQLNSRRGDPLAIVDNMLLLDLMLDESAGAADGDGE
jgi:hypothetical protein